MYPGTIINLIDQSGMQEEQPRLPDFKPLILTFSSFNRGPEELTLVKGDDFFKLYGNKMDFARNGQPALQAANVIRSGGSLLVKRLVADDSALGNLVLSLVLTSAITVEAATEESEESKVIPLSDITGKEEDAETMVVITNSTGTVKWIASSVANTKSIDEVVASATEIYEKGEVTTEDNATYTQTTTYPMFVFTDNGRGESSKAIKLSPDYYSSSGMDMFFYDIDIYEGTTVLDKREMTADPNYVFDKIRYGLSEDTSIQINASNVPGMYEQLVASLAALLGEDEDIVKSMDLIFFTKNDESAIPNIVVDPESIDLNAPYGVEFSNGSDGAFAEAAFGTEEYIAKALEAIEGEYDSAIFDVDEYKISAVFDANYPVAIKDAIAQLANFRKDFHFFRDYGLEVNSYNQIMREHSEINKKYKTCYMSEYFTTYQIYDPETLIRERVTMMYDFASAAMGIFGSGAFRPYAGIVNGMILESAIKGTINFIPRTMPAVDQKKLIDDARINYAIFNNEQCVVQTLYTSQEKKTELSYINNITAVQEVIRAIRTECPKWRYTFTTNSDFSLYAKNVANVLDPFQQYFSYLSFEYQQNRAKARQKIFYGVIEVRFGDWAQTEEFDVYALGDNS